MSDTKISRGIQSIKMRRCTRFCVLWLMWIASGQSDEPKIFCYYHSLAMTKVGYARMNPSDINPNLCTHLVYASVGISEEGEVTVSSESFAMTDNRRIATFRKFNALRKRNEKLKTLVSCGGWADSSAFSKIAANATLRSKYVKSATDFVLRYQFDGFDIFWQYPTDPPSGGTPDDVSNYVLLLKELRESFDEHELILTNTVEGDEIWAKDYYDIPGISKYVDLIALDVIHERTYKRPIDPITSHNAPLYPAEREKTDSDRKRNTEAAVRYWLDKGAPAKKLVLGTNFYGIGFKLNDSAQHLPGSPASGELDGYGFGNGLISYNEICILVSQAAWTSVWDKEQRVPYTYAGNAWISYDNVRSLIEKGKYAKSMGLGGVMVWSVDSDDHFGECGELFPLLKALNCGLRDINCSSVTSRIFDFKDDPDGDAQGTCARFDLKYVRHPRDCTKFWICLKKGENNYHAEPFSCGSGLHFDTSKNICRNKNMVQCP